MTRTAERQNAALDALADALRADARSYAAQVRSLAELGCAAGVEAARSRTRQFPMMEVAGTARMGQSAACRRLSDADRMVTTLPRTLALLKSGELLVHQAKVLLAETGSCAPEVARRVEDRLLPAAADLCPADLRPRVKRAVLQVESQLDAERADGQREAEQRLADARAGRRTWAVPAPDGMGEAGALLTAEQLRRWSQDLDALERIERRADRDSGVERSADQRRADLFAALPAMVLTARAALAALFATGHGGGHRPDGSGGRGGGGSDSAAGPEQLPALLRPGGSATPVPTVLTVLVPVATILDASCEPATLPGYGPVSAEHVRLLRPVGFRRVLVDHDTGRPVEVDDRVTPAERDPAAARRRVLDMLRTTVVADVAEPQHDPSAHLSRLVDLRDQRCTGPGCASTCAHRDHLEPWPQGPTAAWNLGLLSARCHQAKHTGWILVRHPDGSTTWTSPLGRRYRRPSPHAPPPAVDPDSELPPLRPPATAPPPRWVVARSAGEPPESPVDDPTAAVQDDDEPPPF